MNLDRLMQVAKELDSQQLAEVVDFAEYLRVKAGREPDAESRPWLDADLSGLGDIEPYDWGPAGKPEGDPVRWDEAQGAFVVEERGR